MIGKLFSATTLRWRLEDETIALALADPSMAQRIEKLAATSIYSLRLDPETAELRDRVLWRRRAAAAHDWLGYATLINIPMVASYGLLPEGSFTIGVLMHLLFVPLAFALSMTAWISPRPSWVEGFSVIGYVSCLTIVSLTVGLMGGGDMQERSVAVVFMVILTAIAVIPLADSWVVSLGVLNCIVYTLTQSFNPRIDTLVVVMMTLLFAAICGAVVFARLTANRLQTRAAVLGFRDILRVRQMRDVNRHLEVAAMTDALTGVANRRNLTALVEQALQDGPDGLHWLAIDLDGFKGVNDSWGHEAGDEVLIAACRRIVEAVGPDGFVARIGGDEFVVIFSGSPEDAESVSRRIESRLGDPIRVGRGFARIGASVGLTSIGPDDTIDAVSRRADARMYDIKRRRRAA